MSDTAQTQRVPEVPQGYKQTEVGVIPEDWGVTNLGKLLSERPSYGINAPAVSFDNRLPTYLRITDISDDGRFQKNSKVSVNHPGAQNYRLCEGDLVIARTGASVGKSYQYRLDDGELIFAGFLIRFRPNREKLDPTYLRFYLQTRQYWRWVQTTSMRSGQPGINGKEYASLHLSLPPTINEQQAIAEALGDADALIEGLEALISKKQQVKQGAMLKLMQPGQGWSTHALEDIADVIDPHPSHRAPPATHQGVPFVGIGDLNENGDLINEKVRKVDPRVLIEHKARYSLTDELIGLGRVASIGKVVKLKPLGSGFAISPTLGVIRGRNVPRDFLLYALKSEYVTSQFAQIMSGSTRSSVGMIVLRKLNIALPEDIGKIKQTAYILSDIDDELMTLKAKLLKARRVKEGMMQDLLTGKVRLV